MKVSRDFLNDLIPFFTKKMTTFALHILIQHETA
jgi:hypothetical protein